MKPGGLKLLERSPCKLTPRYKADGVRELPNGVLHAHKAFLDTALQLAKQKEW